MALSDWSSTAANNSTVLGTSIAEGCPPGNINNALRQAMADIAGGINYSVIGPVLSAASLSAARSALGVASPTSNTSLTNLGNLTNSASKLPYMTGGDAWSTVSFPTFGRSLVACGDAATALALLGVTGSGSSSLASTGYATFAFGATNLKLQWGSQSIGANTSATITYPSAYSSFSVCVVSGGPASTSDDANIRTLSCGTTSATVVNNYGGSATAFWIAIGV